MSTDRQRVKRAIQRIAVQAPELQSFLKDAESKGGKAKSAGVGSSSEAQGDRVCCDGSTSVNANPGAEERDPDSGGQEGGLNGDDPALLENGEGTLSGVTDCATGEPICFDGAGFIPPDGWDEPDDPPTDPTYEEGKFWANGDSFSLDCCTASPTQDGAQALIGPCDSGTFLVSVRQYNCVGSGTTYSNYCGGADPSVCDPDPEDIQEDWPSDGCTNLIVKDGKIVGSRYDPENDGSYSAPRDSIDLCSGGDQISLAPSANGGWKTINSTTDNGYLYNSSGEQIAHIDGNEYSDPSI